jgi:hypothetical protein
MTRMRVQGAILMFVLSATVAVFSGVVPVPFLNAGERNALAIRPTGAVTIIADGTDPVPPPKPLPWLGTAS